MEINAIHTRIFSKPDTTNPDTPLSLHEAKLPLREKHTTRDSTRLTPETALEILTSQPQSEDLLFVLRWLDHCSSSSSSSCVSSSVSTVSRKNTSTSTSTTTSDNSSSPNSDPKNYINIKIPSPKSSQLIHALVNDIIPHHWPLSTPISSTTATAANADNDKDNDDANETQTTKKIRSLLIRNLHSVAAVGALVARLRALCAEVSLEPEGSGGKKEMGGGKGDIGALATAMEVLEAVLQGVGFLRGVWAAAASDYGPGMEEEMEQEEEGEGVKMKVKVRELRWKEGVGLLAGGRVLSAAGEAERVLREGSEGVRGEGSWVADGEKYAGWLGRNVWHMVVHVGRNGAEESRAAAAAGQALAKGLKLGYFDAIVRAVFADLIAGDEGSIRRSLRLLDCLAVHEQKMVLHALIRALEKRYLSSGGARQVENNGDLLGSIAALLAAVIDGSPVHKDIMIEWLTGLSAEAARQSHLTHRAVVLALSAAGTSVKTALTRALELFADKLFIKHTPIFQQEINTQILLLLIGYVHRADKMSLEKISKSSLYLNAISNHLASTSLRSRFLGMIVGTSVSDLVDTRDKRMNFSSDEMEGSDGRWYRALTGVNDQTRPVKDLLSISGTKQQSAPKRLSTTPSTDRKPRSVAPMKGSSKIIAIEELADDSSEEDDLPTYAKPHSDPEDSDEDPELVQRNKATAPVYIRDLLGGLRDLDNYDRHRLALSTASSLIRRKASFGTEVTDNIEDIATVLVGLNDKYEMDSFQRYRLQGMIALLIAAPEVMGPWYARAFYNGEYSMSQRASVLTTLGLGAREIAGLGKEDEAMTGSKMSAESQFPSKRLPEKLHTHYASLQLPPSPLPPPPSSSLPSTPIITLSIALSNKMIQPMAAKAADALTGPSALKTRTFSSRLAVQSRTAAPTANPLAKILAPAFFFPLVGRWSIHIQSSSHKNSSDPTTSPFLLSHFLRTLALILHAGGPTSGASSSTSASSWRDISSEFWSLLLSVRARAEGDLHLLEGLLFAFLTLLDVSLAQGGDSGEGARRVAEEQGGELLETLAWVEGVFERVGDGGIGGIGTGIGDGGKSEEDERVRMLAAGVLGRCREVVERYQRVLMGGLVEGM